MAYVRSAPAAPVSGKLSPFANPVRGSTPSARNSEGSDTVASALLSILSQHLRRACAAGFTNSMQEIQSRVAFQLGFQDSCNSVDFVRSCLEKLDSHAASVLLQGQNRLHDWPLFDSYIETLGWRLQFDHQTAVSPCTCSNRSYTKELVLLDNLLLQYNMVSTVHNLLFVDCTTDSRWYVQLQFINVGGDNLCKYARDLWLKRSAGSPVSHFLCERRVIRDACANKCLLYAISHRACSSAVRTDCLSLWKQIKCMLHPFAPL